MKKLTKKAILAIFFIGMIGNLVSAQNFLDINNVKALINYNGSLFYDFNKNFPGFEVPKGSHNFTIFASTLWIGGFDAGGNLHEAAQTYNQSGPDYWAGPLDTLNLSTDTTGWQTTWKINKTVIDSHRINYNKPGYFLPPEIQNWPANGTGSKSKVLAPYIDVNSNRKYDPAAGDFPYIFGDQAVYYIMNDSFSKHTETKAKPMGIEIHTMAYAFNSAISGFLLDNIVFVRFDIKNRSNQNYHDVYAGIWTDFDIGYAYDDYVGSDSARNMYFGYNGDSIDQGVVGYGTNPPVQAIKFLNRQMNYFMYYDNDFTPKGNPSEAIHYYNYLSGRFKNGQHLRYGGDGYNKVWDSARYQNNMFPSDPRQQKPAWNEVSSGNFPGDRRGLGSIGPLNMNAGEVLTLDIAYIYVRKPHPYYLDVFDDLNADADQVQKLYNEGRLTNPNLMNIQEVKTNLALTISPNPMESFAVISFTNPENKDYNLQITDLYGRTIYQKQAIKSNHIRIDRNDLKPGLFIVTLTSDNNRGQMKLIVK